MSNTPTAIPKNIQDILRSVNSFPVQFSPNTKALADYITSLHEVPIVPEPFVVYRVEINGTSHIGFRVQRDVAKPWVVTDASSAYLGAEHVFPGYDTACLAADAAVKVLGRYTPEAPVIEFGIEDGLEPGTPVLIRASLESGFIDTDGDILVNTAASCPIYIRAEDVAVFDTEESE